MDSRKLEKYSSAITLADMEVFVFPELMYSLVLANIMSPIPWQWRQDETFQKLEGKSPYRKFMRLKQFIMDEYEFNLDLNTWGLTHKDIEIQRFSPFISPEDIARSNALFGYTGDKYYFDVDIRRHFGLDQYEGDIIPYWKTETVEAMTAFRYKDGYGRGAGECVSLSTLYAAASFVVCDIPLPDIYLVLTPLHSQTFLDLQDGIITNNRRVVTKSMWFNGTALSNKAQRALRNEQVTIVANNSGHVHCFYPEATIDPDVYRKLSKLLRGYLSTELDLMMFANFLRSYPRHQTSFQFCRELRGEHMFVKAEVLYRYEHDSTYRIGDHTFDKLLDEVSSEDYSRYKYVDRICAEQVMAFVRYEKIDLRRAPDREKLAKYLAVVSPDSRQLVEELYAFIHIEPRLPALEKQYRSVRPVELTSEMTREEIVDYLDGLRAENEVADLAFYAYRDMSRCDWEPLLKASIERSPVSIHQSRNMSIEQAYAWLSAMPGNSIYDGQRVAHPDEVANYGVADGIEKAITFANVLHQRQPESLVRIAAEGSQVVVITPDGRDFRFESAKDFHTELVVDDRFGTAFIA